jgi:hypothetical protein
MGSHTQGPGEIGTVEGSVPAAPEFPWPRCGFSSTSHLPLPVAAASGSPALCCGQG